MRRTWIFLLAAAAALLAAGSDPLDLLPYAREIDTVVLMRTMGVDLAGEGVAVTLSSGAEDGEAPALLSGEGGTMSGALLALQGRGESSLFYGHVGQLLLGEPLAAENLLPPLDYVLRDVEMRLDTDLYVLRDGEAGAAIRAVSAPGESAADRLEAMADDAGLLSATMARTVGEVLMDLEEQGASFAPALRETDGELEPAGYAVLKGNALAGWAEGDAARGVNLFLGRVDADVLETENAALRIVGARSRVRPVFEGDVLTGLEVLCKVEANLAEAAPGVDLRDREELAALEQILAETTAARLRAALELARDLDADYLGLKQAACLAAPWRKADIQTQWDLRTLALDVTVRGTVERGYDVTR